MRELSEDQVVAEAAGVMEERERTVLRNSTIFHKLCELIWPTMQKHELSSCITGTRIAFDVCRRYGIRVSAHVTRVRVYNAPMFTRIRRGEVPKDTAEIERWEKEDGSWNVGVGGFGYDQPGRFDGHLVAVALGSILLDTTIAQVNRPEHGIEIGASPATVPEGWPLSDAVTVQASRGGCLVTYEPEPSDDRRWVATESWQDRELRAPAVEEVFPLVDSALAAL